MIHKITRLCLLFLLIFPTLSFAQRKWSLEQCIDYALTNNISIKQQALNVESAKEDLMQSAANMLPSLEGNASYAYNFGQTVDRYTNQFADDKVLSINMAGSSSVTLFNGFQMLNTLKKNIYNLKSSKFDVEKMKNDVSLSIATAYLNILFNMELLDIAKNQYEITKQQSEKTKKLVDAGTLAKGSYLDIEAQVATEELSVVNAQSQLDLSYLILTQMLDIPSTEGFEIEKPLLEIEVQSTLLQNPQQVYAYAVSTQPDVKSSELKVQSSQKGLAIARGTRSLSVSLSGSVGTGYSEAQKEVESVTQAGYSTIGYVEDASFTPVVTPTYDYTYKVKSFNAQAEDNFNKTIGAYLRIPIFNGFYSKASISKAKISLQSAEYDLQLTKNNLYKTIQQAYMDALAALNKFKASTKSVDALQESFKYTEQKFNVGLVNAVDYNDAKNKLTKAQSDLLQAKYDYVFKLKVLDFYLGRPLTLK